MDYDIAKDAIEDAIENRKLAGQARDGGLTEALKIIENEQEFMSEMRGCMPMSPNDVIHKWYSYFGWNKK